MSRRAGITLTVVLAGSLLLTGSALATRTNGNWVIVDNQDAADADGRFGLTMSFGSGVHMNNYLGEHNYFRKPYSGGPVIQGAAGGAVPDGTKWLILDSRSTQFAWGRLGQSLGTVSEGEVYNWSIKVGDRTDTPLPAAYTFGLFSLEDGHLQSISALTQAEITPASGVLTTNITWNSSGSGLDGKTLYFVLCVNTNSGSAANTAQLLCDSVSVKTNGVELVRNGGFESSLASWAVIPLACTWTFKNLPAGAYEIIASWLEASNRKTNARFSINGLTNVYVNQRNPPGQLLLHDNTRWVRFDVLGTHAADNGSMRVTLFAEGAAETDYACADAVAVRRITWTDEQLASNGSFELPALPSGGSSAWGTAVPGWIWFGTPRPPQVVTDANITADPAVPEGAQWGLVDLRSTHHGGGTLLQCLDQVKEGSLYQWRVTFGNRSDVNFLAPTSFGLYTVTNGVFVARSVKAAADVTMAQRSRTTQSFRVTWDSAKSGTDGEQLYFIFKDFPVHSGDSTTQLLIDDLKVHSMRRGTLIRVR